MSERINWDLWPEATHYLPKTLQRPGCFWLFSGSTPIKRMAFSDTSPVTMDLELSQEGRSNLVARPADWAKAPEEATHYVTSIRDRIPTGWYRADGNKMRYLAQEGEYLFRLDDMHEGCGLILEARPAMDWSEAPADDGDKTVATHMQGGEVVAVWADGVPPPMTPVEFKAVDGTWKPGTFVGKVYGKLAVGCDATHCIGFLSSDEMRPAPTPEQLERTRQVGIMNGLLGNGSSHRQGRILFDHGFRQAPGYAELMAFADWVSSTAHLRFANRLELVEKAQAALAASRGDV